MLGIYGQAATPAWARARSIEVRVVPKAGGGYNIIPFEGQRDLKKNELVCHKHESSDNLYKHGVHTLIFRVINAPTTQWRFRSTPTDAFWAAEVGPSATSGPTAASQVADCVPVWVSSDGLLLLVVNKNEDRKRIGYTLRLIDGAGKDHDCDPIMGNGNGGFSLMPSEEANHGSFALAAGLIAGAAALIAGLGYAFTRGAASGGKHRARHK